MPVAEHIICVMAKRIQRAVKRERRKALHLSEGHALQHGGHVELVDSELLVVAGRHEVADELGRAKGEGVHVVGRHAVHAPCCAHRAALRLRLRRRLRTQGHSRVC
jgi:hypothetical protein